MTETQKAEPTPVQTENSEKTEAKRETFGPDQKPEEQSVSDKK